MIVDHKSTHNIERKIRQQRQYIYSTLWCKNIVMSSHVHRIIYCPNIYLECDQ